MFSFITGKVKSVAIAVLAVALPVIYLLGRSKGSQATQAAVLRDDLETAGKQADFYKAIQDHEIDIQSDAPRDRRTLVERLRRDGL